MKKKILTLMAFLVVCSLAVLKIGTTASAEPEPNYGEIIITSDGLECKEGFDCTSISGYSYKKEGKILTLENYRAPYGFYIENTDITIELKGENVFEASEEENRIAIFAENSKIEVTGNGFLDASDCFSAFRMKSPEEPKKLIINAKGGSVTGNLESFVTEVQDGTLNTPTLYGFFIQKGGEVNYSYSRNRNSGLYGLFIEDGVFNSTSPLYIASFLNQFGGELNVDISEITDNGNIIDNEELRDEDFQSAVMTTYAVFRGGKTSLKGGLVTSLNVGGEIDEAEATADLEDIKYFYDKATLPKQGVIEIDGGNVEMENSTGVGVLFVMVYTIENEGSSVTESDVYIADNMAIDPEGAKPTIIDIEVESGSYQPAVVFSDGKGDPELEVHMSEEFSSPTFITKNIAKSVHIYPKEEPEPEPEDSEEDEEDKENEEDPLKILEGSDQKLDISDLKDLIVRYNRDIKLFKKVLIDNQEVPKENYTLDSGSTILTIKADYLKGLKAGEHTLTAYFEGEDKPAETKFTLTAKSAGDEGIFTAIKNDSKTSFILASIISTLTLAILVIHKKSKNKKLDRKYN